MDGWLTPPEYLGVLRRFAPVAYDPSGARASLVGAAATSLPEEEDGLAADWCRRARGGLSFFNPPYGEVIGLWTAKAAAEARRDFGFEGIGLIPAYPGAPWFDAIWETASAIHFWRGRLTFWDPKTRAPRDNSAPFYSASVYWGRRVDAFREAFAVAGLGFWTPPSREWRHG